MKRILPALRSLALFAAVAPAAFGALAQQVPQPPEIAARTYMLVDVTANQVLAAKDIDAPVEQASLTKLMTGYLVFDALRAKKVTLDQKLPVSVRAWKMPLSRSSTDTCILGSMNMREPGIFQARTLTGSFWSSVTFLARSASNTR